MIFVTVGTQLPFDRLLRAMDEWAGDNPQTKVVAQTGMTKFHGGFLHSYGFLSPDKYLDFVKCSEIVIGHAGTGTLLSALALEKPAILMPRRSELKEHRNDHQVGMAQVFSGIEGINFVYDKSELLSCLTTLKSLETPKMSKTRRGSKLVEFIREEIMSF